MTALASCRRGLPTLAALLLLATGCGGGGDDPGAASPTAVLAEAKDKVDAASTLRLELRTDSVPTSGNAVLAAVGTGTRQPAFEGEVTASLNGLTGEVPVVSVDGKVFAKLPLSTDFATIDPRDYGVPDPADFMDPARGVSGLLTALDDVDAGEQTRAGAKVLRSYTGTLPGSAVQPVIPSADASSDYVTTVGVDESGYPATIEITGSFFAADEDVTYDLTLDDFGRDVTVTAPAVPPSGR